MSTSLCGLLSRDCIGDGRREGDQRQELVECILSIVDDSQHEQEPHVPGLQCRSRS